MVTRLDIIAELLLRPAPPPTVAPDDEGRVYRVEGGPYDGQEALLHRCYNLDAELERLTNVWKARRLVFVREQQRSGPPQRRYGPLPKRAKAALAAKATATKTARKSRTKKDA